MQEQADADLVEGFIAAIQGVTGTAIAAQLEGITADDISRWRRGKWQSLTEPKRKALKGFLSRIDAEGGPLLAAPGGMPPDHMTRVYELLDDLDHPESLRRGVGELKTTSLIRSALAVARKNGYTKEELFVVLEWAASKTAAVEGRLVDSITAGRSGST